MKLIRGKLSGAGVTHQPSGHWKLVSFPRPTMMPEGHADSDPRKDTFRSVSLPSLATSQPPCRPNVRANHMTWAIVVVESTVVLP